MTITAKQYGVRAEIWRTIRIRYSATSPLKTKLWRISHAMTAAACRRFDDLSARIGMRGLRRRINSVLSYREGCRDYAS